MEQLNQLHAVSEPGARRRRDRSAGFTLVETAIAMTILAVGLIAMLALQLQAIRMAEWGRHGTEAAIVARTQLERFNRLDWTDAELQPTAWTANVDVSKGVTTDSGMRQQQIFGLTWRITAEPTDPNLRYIDVEVRWREANQDGLMPQRRYAVSSTRYSG